MKNVYTEEYIFSCLACCEAIIDKNLYLTKVWKNTLTEGGEFEAKARKWMAYRTMIRQLLSGRYSTKEIICRSKSCQKKTTQKAVIDLIAQIHKGDVQLEE